jgi:hypothetical protein
MKCVFMVGRRIMLGFGEKLVIAVHKHYKGRHTWATECFHSFLHPVLEEGEWSASYSGKKTLKVGVDPTHSQPEHGNNRKMLPPL